MSGRVNVSAALATLVAVHPALAEGPEAEKTEGALIEAIKSGKPIINVRYRFEWKEQDGFAQDAYANTVRTRLGFEAGEFYHFKVLAEFENVASIGDDHFNSTTNGRTEFPVVADPDATELNRAQVTFTGIEKSAIIVGRQAYTLGDHRFVGDVGFRQNQQTFDAARLSTSIVENLAIDYAYISRVHRIFGDDHPLGEFDSDSHVISAVYDGKKMGKLSGYGLLLEFEEAPALSSATWGARYENTLTLEESVGIKFGFAAEYASQRDRANNPVDYHEHYLRGEASLKVADAGLKVGYERLGGDGVIGFSTPLATLHKFQGFADVFLTTPAAGIEDIYGTLDYAWKSAPFGGSAKFFVTYHSFESERGDVDYGDEIDAGAALSFAKHWTVEVKGAHYDGAAGFADRNLIWASLQFSY